MPVPVPESFFAPVMGNIRAERAIVGWYRFDDTPSYEDARIVVPCLEIHRSQLNMWKDIPMPVDAVSSPANIPGRTTRNGANLDKLGGFMTGLHGDPTIKPCTVTGCRRIFEPLIQLSGMKEHIDVSWYVCVRSSDTLSPPHSSHPCVGRSVSVSVGDWMVSPIY